MLGFRNNTNCVVKMVPKKQCKKQILNEIKVLSILNHENIVKFLHYTESNLKAFVFLEYCPG